MIVEEMIINCDENISQENILNAKIIEMLDVNFDSIELSTSDTFTVIAVEPDTDAIVVQSTTNVVNMNNDLHLCDNSFKKNVINDNISQCETAACDDSQISNKKCIDALPLASSNLVNDDDKECPVVSTKDALDLSIPKSNHVSIDKEPLKDITNFSKQPKSVKELLIYPSQDALKKYKKGTRGKTQSSSVISGPEWQKSVEMKENDKKRKAEELALRKKIKIEKSEKSKVTKESESMKKEEEKFLKEQQRLQKEKDKFAKLQKSIEDLNTKNKAREEALLKQKE